MGRLLGEGSGGKQRREGGGRGEEGKREGRGEGMPLCRQWGFRGICFSKSSASSPFLLKCLHCVSTPFTLFLQYPPLEVL